MRTPATWLGAAAVALVWAAFGPAGALAAPSFGTISGRVVDQTGAPLPGARIEVAAGGDIVAAVVADEDGTYLVERVPAATVELTVRLLNFATVRRQVVVPAGAMATVDHTLPLAIDADVTVTGRRTFRNLADVPDPTRSLVGIASAASQGAITSAQLDARPIMRSAEVLETVPGVVVSQHSGEGKANQYYLRGFNLDHGTDFATTIEGVPVNMPSHGHGQGYTDVNFLIPELVSGIQFRKGPYYADTGDFSAAGAATLRYVSELEQPIVRAGGGQLGWRRIVAAASPRVGAGRLLTALELNENDGPWSRPDDYRRLNAVLRYARGDAQRGATITAMGYWARWNATDQVPARALRSGRLSRFDGLDPTSGGDTHRASLSGAWQHADPSTTTRVAGFAMSYGLNLFSNFTFALADPVNGDQFEQVDRRRVAGGSVTHRRLGQLGARATETLVGAELRHDAIGEVGLYATRQRERIGQVRRDAVDQTALGLFAESQIEWTRWLRTTVGLRGDVYRFAVRSDLPANSGRVWDAIVQPKLSAAFGPWRGTELYASAGVGFHSNDARGATIRVDPVDRRPVAPVTPLVPARGAEVGVRTIRIPGVQSTVALWTLGLDSELVFVGDAGTTDVGRASRRYGVEWTNYVRLGSAITLDADLALSRARFTEASTAGDRIPGSVGRVASVGISVAPPDGPVSGTIRLRHLGPRTLVEDDRLRSPSTTLVNVQAGIRLSRGARLRLDVFNVLDALASDIDYFYRSRLPGEAPGGVEDVHLHPTLPRSARLSLEIAF